ncbi:MAG: STM3941 family protein [Acidithiobacillus sp.]
MNDTHTFRASKVKALLTLLGSLAFVAAGIWISAEKPILGWICAGFFALGVPASILMMLPNYSFLRLDSDGFEMGSLFGSQKILWSEVDGFRICSNRGVKIIEIVFNENHTRHKVGRAVASAVARMEGAIANIYDAPLAEVLASLNSWKHRFATQRTNIPVKAAPFGRWALRDKAAQRRSHLR